MTTAYSYETCDLAPWLQEISNRMHEAAAANTNRVNLSCSHPRGYIPNQILRRPMVRKLMTGWTYDNSRSFPHPAPDNWFKSGLNYETCSTRAFEKEISLREKEAQAEVKAGRAMFPVVDLTTWHPRGGIPKTILERIERRGDRDWRIEMQQEIDSLLGEANKAEAHSGTMKARAEIQVSKGNSPEALLNASKEAMKRAADLRAQAELIKKEMGEAA